MQSSSLASDCGDRCRLRLARSLSRLLKAVSITSMATLSWLMRAHKAGFCSVSPVNTQAGLLFGLPALDLLLEMA